MKILKLPFLQSCLLIFFYSSLFANNNNAGFYLPDSVREMRIPFRSVDNLIILPVTLNDSIKLNLILDTGCRNLVIFGKRFKKMLKTNPDREIIFSGLGSGSAVKGLLSINNKVSIYSVVGKFMPIVIVPDKNLFSQYRDIDGVIGYDIFLKFEIEINSRENIITFRKAFNATPPADYAQVPLKVVDSRPIMQSQILFEDDQTAACDLMIDTGSSIGLLLKTTDLKQYNNHYRKEAVGRGLNGLLYGFITKASQLTVGTFNFTGVSAGIIESEWHNNASIGMALLKDYIVVLNYCKSYACFKKLV